MSIDKLKIANQKLKSKNRGKFPELNAIANNASQNNRIAAIKAQKPSVLPINNLLIPKPSHINPSQNPRPSNPAPNPKAN